MMQILNKIALITLLLCMRIASASATTYYVDVVNGSDSNSTTQAKSSLTPWKTISKAIFTPNDVTEIVVAPGTYPEVVYLNTKSNITIRASSTTRPVIRPNDSTKNFVIWISGQHDVTIRGFEINGNDVSEVADGVSIANGSYNVNIINNVVHDCGGGGIGTNNANVTRGGPGGDPGGCDYITIEGNSVYNNCFTSKYDTSGISLFGCSKLNNNSGFHSVIRGNRVFSNQSFYTPPSFSGGDHTDGNGIIIDQQANGPSTLIENNLVYDNGGRGIHVYKSQNITIRNNTTYKNCQDPKVQDGELTAGQASNVLFANNIAYGNGNTSINKVWNSTGVTFRYNLYYSGPATYGTWDTYGNPLFQSPGVAYNSDFRCKTTPTLSPAIDSGENSNRAATDFLGVNRPVGATVDRGAYESQAPSAPLAGSGSNG